MTTHQSSFPRYQWPAGNSSAFCFTVDVDAESVHLWALKNDQSQRTLGAMERRIFGPRTGSWRLLDLLDRYGIKGTFFVPGYVAETYPDLLPAFVGRGHEVGLHGYFHELATEIEDSEFVGALEAALAVFKKQIGIVPKGFRSPSWEMTPFMLAELKRRGLYDSSLMGFDHPYTADGVAEIPVQWMVDDAVYFKFDGGGVDKWPPAAQDGVLSTWLDEWDVISREGDLFMLTVHDWISGRAARIRMLEKLLDVITRTPSVWIATVGAVADHHRSSANSDKYNVQARTPHAIGPRRFMGGR
jgi:peptidoglycan/xylan/chitin deacetylase (PgdA/CDA1 family)